MPDLLLREIPAALVIRVRSFAKSHRLDLDLAVVELLVRGLAATRQRVAAGRARQASQTPEQRSAAASRAARARWPVKPD